MKDFPGKPAIGLLLVVGIVVSVVACGGGSGGEDTPEAPIDVDYSLLQVAESRELPLQYAQSQEEILRPLRNGLRILTIGGAITGLTNSGIAFTSGGDASAPHSGTTVQVNGVDEADSVKYDGRHIFAARRESTPTSSPTAPYTGRNVLDIARTDADAGTVEPLSPYVIEGEQTGAPMLYHLPTPDGAAEQIVAVSQDFRGWLMPQLPVASLVVQPDRTTIQLLDVRDPRHVSQTWKLELDGWMSASRLIGDTLYVVSNYRPRIRDLLLPADTPEKREVNERRIRSASAQDLLPTYSVNGGARQALVSSDGCLVAQQTGSNDSYTDLLVISAINLHTQRVTDVNCLSTNVNGVYMSLNSLYIAGNGFRPDATPITVLHKFAIQGGTVTYRATGAVVGSVPWRTPSYFMDEHEGDLRILTSNNGVHRLNVLRESTGRSLLLVATLPNTSRPAAIGKPGEAVYAVRFFGKRAYVVTFRVTDPLYVIDLRNPQDPAIAGELEVPGFSTYLQPLGATDSEFLLAVGQEASPEGQRRGVKVELFDVRDIANPRSLGARVFGKAGTSSEGLRDPHALTFLATPTPQAGLRLALPIDVFETPRAEDPNAFDWTYSGLHLLEVSGTDTADPQLRFQGVLETDRRGPDRTFPSFAAPDRGVLHGESVFAVHGDRLLSTRWQDLVVE